MLGLIRLHVFTICIYSVSVYKLHVHNFELKSIHGILKMAVKKSIFMVLISCIKSMDINYWYSIMCSKYIFWHKKPEIYVEIQVKIRLYTRYSVFSTVRNPLFPIRSP